MTGIETSAPYLMKSVNLKRILFLATKPENMMPASAPIGVRNAPILLPIIEAYTPVKYWDSAREFTKFENKIDIGILLIKLLAKKEE